MTRTLFAHETTNNWKWQQLHAQINHFEGALMEHIYYVKINVHTVLIR